MSAALFMPGVAPHLTGTHCPVCDAYARRVAMYVIGEGDGAICICRPCAERIADALRSTRKEVAA